MKVVLPTSASPIKHNLKVGMSGIVWKFPNKMMGFNFVEMINNYNRNGIVPKIRQESSIHHVSIHGIS